MTRRRCSPSTVPFLFWEKSNLDITKHEFHRHIVSLIHDVDVHTRMRSGSQQLRSFLCLKLHNPVSLRPGKEKANSTIWPLAFSSRRQFLAGLGLSGPGAACSCLLLIQPLQILDSRSLKILSALLLFIHVHISTRLIKSRSRSAWWQLIAALTFERFTDSLNSYSLFAQPL